MAIYYDSITKQFYEKDEYAAVPSGSRKIEPDAHEYYCAQQGYYHIYLDAVDGDVITLAGIKAQGVDISHLRALRLDEANAACQEAIYGGVDAETSLGVKHFSLTDHDQTELLGLSVRVKAGADAVAYHADGELCRMWDAADFTKIFSAAQAHVFYHRTYCNFFRAYIKRMTLDELWDAVYGMTLPEDLADGMAALLSGEEKP